ncbi:7,8-dihydro-8-oxoguanine triphosphatase, partial [Trichinella zimbabwensis]
LHDAMNTPLWKKYSLVMVRRGEKILLGLKKQGFGCGKWNGFGGKMEQGETIEETAKRELYEETNLTCERVDKFGILRFEFEKCPILMEVHAFHAINVIGDPQESYEMIPRWFDLNCIPFHQMWPDDKLWWQYFSSNRKFKGYFLYDETQRILLDHAIKLDDDLDQY